MLILLLSKHKGMERLFITSNSYHFLNKTDIEQSFRKRNELNFVEGDVPNDKQTI